MARYVALVDGNAGAYGVTVPDLLGCTSGGTTTDEALRNAVEAVRLWAEDAIADGEALPQPRSVETLRRRSPRVPLSRSSPCYSTPGARPKPICRSTPGFSLPLTRQPKHVG